MAESLRVTAGNDGEYVVVEGDDGAGRVTCRDILLVEWRAEDRHLAAVAPILALARDLDAVRRPRVAGGEWTLEDHIRPEKNIGYLRICRGGRRVADVFPYANDSSGEFAREQATLVVEQMNREVGGAAQE